MASATEHEFPLATENYFPVDGVGDGDDPGAANHGVDSDAGASGESGGMKISEEALIAIIVVVSVIAVLGVSMAILFYIAKKREWKMRQKLRQSARKVVNAITPRRTEFPKEVKDTMAKAGRGRKLPDDVPPTPRLRPEDVEKGLAVSVKVEGGKPKKKWGRK